MDTTVLIAPELYQALNFLGGSVEEHVALAIADYVQAKAQEDQDWWKHDHLLFDYGKAQDEPTEEPEEDEDEDENLSWAEDVTKGSVAA